MTSSIASPVRPLRSLAATVRQAARNPFWSLFYLAAGSLTVVLLAASTVIGVPPGAAARPQTTPPAFDVVSIKPADFVGRGYGRGPGAVGFGPQSVTPGGFRANAATLRAIFAFAYDVNNVDTQVKGLTGWMETDRWTIEARTPAGAADLTKNLPLAREMTQQLLAARFGLKVATQSTTAKIYELRLAGEKPTHMTDATDPTQPHRLAVDGEEIMAEAITMPDLARALSGGLDHSVVDDTGLPGTYQFDIKMSPLPQGTSMLEMMQIQYPQLVAALGLKLVAAEGPVTSYTILAADRPKPD